MFFLFSTAKPLHHHGQECLRLKVDVVGPHGKSYQFFTLPTRHFCNLYWIIRTTEALLTARLYHLILGSKNKNKKKTVEKEDEMEVKSAGGVHNPSNRLPAGENFSSVTLLFASGSVSICFRKDVEFPSQGVRVTLRKLHGHEMYSSSFSSTFRWPYCHDPSCAEERGQFRRSCGTRLKFRHVDLYTHLSAPPLSLI